MLLFVLPFKKSQSKHETNERITEFFNLENSTMDKLVILPTMISG